MIDPTALEGMPTRPRGWRKPVGSLILIAGLVFYVGLAVWLSTAVLPQHWAVDLIFYPLAGVAWVWPAAKLTGWIGREKFRD